MIYKQSIDFNDLGDTCKKYERRSTSDKLMDGIPVIARLDGRGFSKLCKGLERPFDSRMSSLMKDTAKFLLERYNASLAYTQSDEITLVWVNFEADTKMIFGAKVHKLTSLLAASASVYFCKNIPTAIPEKESHFAEFDCRIWNVPNLRKAAEAVLWREMDATRNSISMAAQTYFSHKELQGVGTKEMTSRLLEEKNITWANYPDFFKKGTYFTKHRVSRALTEKELEGLPEKHHARIDPAARYQRRIISELDIKPLLKVEDMVATLFPKEDEEPSVSDLEQ